MMLSLAAGMPNFEPCAAKRRSHAIATAIAPPMQKPNTMATVGFGQTRMAVYAASVVALYASAVAVSLRLSWNSEMSAPEANAWRPAPRYTMARTVASPASSLVRDAISPHMARLMALRIAGRLNTTVAMWSSRSTWIRSLMCSSSVSWVTAPAEERADGGDAGLATRAGAGERQSRGPS